MIARTIKETTNIKKYIKGFEIGVLKISLKVKYPKIHMPKYIINTLINVNIYFLIIPLHFTLNVILHL